jgi:hypothetical protein
VVAWKRRRVDTGKCGASGYLGVLALPGGQSDPCSVPGQIGRTPEIQPEGLISAPTVIEPLVGLANGRDSGPTITRVSVPDSFPRRQQRQQQGIFLIVGRGFSGSVDKVGRLPAVSRPSPALPACNAIEARAVTRTSGTSATSAKWQVSSRHRRALSCQPASWASHPACSMVAAVTFCNSRPTEGG